MGFAWKVQTMLRDGLPAACPNSEAKPTARQYQADHTDVVVRTLCGYYLSRSLEQSA